MIDVRGKAVELSLAQACTKWPRWYVTQAQTTKQALLILFTRLALVMQSQLLRYVPTQAWANGASQSATCAAALGVQATAGGPVHCTTARSEVQATSAGGGPRAFCTLASMGPRIGQCWQFGVLPPREALCGTATQTGLAVTASSSATQSSPKAAAVLNSMNAALR
jgi:hypothetical protein